MRQQGLIIGWFVIGISLVWGQQPFLPFNAISAPPFIQNYSPEDYGGFSQNWGAIQDSRGVLYVSNNFGLLEYDGVRWELYRPPSPNPIKSVAMEPHEQIYWGGLSDFGYLGIDSVGTPKLISLVQLLPDSLKIFDLIEKIAVTRDGIYFGSEKGLYRWQPEGKQGISPKGNLQLLFRGTNTQLCYSAYDEVYIRVPGQGLMRLTDHSLQIIPGGEKFSSMRIHALGVYPYPEGKANIWISTVSDGVFIYDREAKQFSPFPFNKQAKDFLAGKFIYSACLLQDGSIALASIQKGLGIVNQQGELIRYINQASGLRDAVITNVFQEKGGGLWLSLNDGLAYAETHTPFAIYTTPQGMDMDLNALAWSDKGELYLGGSHGVYKLSQAEDAVSTTVFEKIEEIEKLVYDLQFVDDALLAASNGTLYEIRKDEAQVIHPLISTCLHLSQYTKGLLYVGTTDGLAVFRHQHGAWQFLCKLTGLRKEVRNIAETGNGELWCGLQKGYAHIQIPMDSWGFPIMEGDTAITPIQLDIYDDFEIPGRFLHAEDKLLFARDAGLVMFDSNQKDFEFVKKLGPLSFDTIRNYQLSYQDSEGGYWVESFPKSNLQIDYTYPTGKGQYETLTEPFYRLNKFETVWDIKSNPLQPRWVWFAADNGLIAFDKEVKRAYSPLHPPIVKKVNSVAGGVIYGGNESQNKASYNLSYEENALRFSYALPFFEKPEATLYQVMLEGLDKKWSVWTSETQKDYTNLREGTYHFRVRAQNVYGKISEEVVFKFSISPPWFRTWWAYSLYLLVAVGSVFLLIRVRERNLKHKNRALSNIIAERTQELSEKNEKLQELDETKSRFFTNISHEFRTPLTVISGLADLMEKGETRQLIQRNSNRLLSLVNQILDLRKLESGKLHLNLQQGNIIPFIKYNLESFQSYAESKSIDLHFSSEVNEVVMDYDQEKLQSVLTNLIANAIKFTPEGGKVRLNADRVSNPVSVKSQDILALSVSDTGIGIPPKKLPHIFDRFYQADDSITRQGEGTGIGLTLTHEFVKFMEGDIEVESVVGKGTTFHIRLPIHQKALKIEQQPTQPYVIPEATPLASSEAWGKETSGYRLLIVEDNPDVVHYLQACLHESYQVIVAKDGQEGIEMALNEVPDIIISDVMMPRKDGFELCETLKQDERTSHIPIILLTAKADVESRISGLTRGADAYLAKPFNKEELLVRLEMLIKLRKSLQQRYAQPMDALPSSDDKAIQQEDAFILKLRNTILNRLDDSELNVTKLCEVMGTSRAQLHRKVTALTGKSASRFLRKVRLEEAQKLLHNSSLNISEIAYEVGFNDPAYFSRIFSEEFGTSPTEARK